MNSELSHADSHRLSAAQGWLELGNPAEARTELAGIAADHQQHPDVLSLRWHIHAHAGDWESAMEAADALIRLDPSRADAWIHRSFALHELKRTRQAFAELRPALERFPEIWTIPYNLACYCAQLGRLADARFYLDQAGRIDADAVQESAAKDPDLLPLRVTT